MTSRNIFTNTLNMHPRGKPTQSQSPLHKKQYYKFVTDNSKPQVDQTMQHQKSRQPSANDEAVQKDKKEEFKKEIERRFVKSTVGSTYQFPRRKSDLSDTMSDGSADSLMRLADTVKYDLHSQNLRHYAKSQATLSIKNPKISGNQKPTKPAHPLKEIANAQSAIKKKIAHNQIFQTFDNRHSNQSEESLHRAFKDTFSEQKQKPVEKAKIDLYYDQNTLRREETPATNDTAFSTLNKINPGGSSNNLPKSFLQSNKLNTVQQLAPHQLLTSLNKRRTLDSKQGSTKDLLVLPQSFSTRNSNLTNRNSTTTSMRTTAQTNFFSSKNISNSKFAVGNQKVINSKKIIDAGLLSSNVNYGISNPLDTNNKEEGLSQRNETVERFTAFNDMPDSLAHKVMFGTFDGEQKPGSRSQSRNQLRSTSNLYTKTQNDLLKKIKTNDIEYAPLATLAKYTQGSMTSRIPSRPVGTVPSKLGGPSTYIPTKSQNSATMSPQLSNGKKHTELRVPKLEIPRATAETSKPHLEGEHSTRRTPRQPQYEKMLEKASHSGVRNSYSRGIESRIETSVLKLDLKNFALRSGAKTDRGKVDSISINGNAKRQFDWM